MAINYTTALKSARLNATRERFLNGSLEIITASDVVLATFGFTATAGTVTGDVWNIAFTNSTVAAGGTGIAAKAVFRTSGGAADLTGLTVGTSASDVIIDNTSINAGQNVSLSSAAITHAA